MDVSIIIPTYNRLWCLPKAIKSCENTRCNAEIIVVDDGSDDGTWEWLCGQEGLNIVRQQHFGKCWAANKGFQLATGKYIRFLDADDELTAGAIDEQFLLAEKENADLVVSGYQICDTSRHIIHQQLYINCGDFVAQQLGECDGSHYSAFLFTRSFLTDIPHRPDFAYRDDRMLILEVALKNPRIAIHQGYALIHQQHQNNRLQHTKGITQSVQNHQHLAIYQHIIKRLKAEGVLNSRRISAALNILWPLAHWIAIYHLNDAVKLTQYIRQLNPEFKIPEKGLLRILYKALGFKKTQHLLKIRRFFKKILTPK